MDRKKIKFGVIGLGHIGKLHASIISQHKHAKLEAVCDLNVTLADFYTEPCVFFDSLQTLINSSIEFDILSIATPNGLHEQHALLALNAGKHVIIEKPMALSKAGCNRIIEAATRAERKVFCVMQNRYASTSLWLKNLLEKEILGKIFMVNISCYWNRDERYYTSGGWHGSKEMDGGPLFTQFSHFLDAILWLFGDVDNIYFRGANFNHHKATEFEDSGTILFDFKKGGSGWLQYTTSCWSRNLGSRMTVIAENGFLEIEGQYMENVTKCHIKKYKLAIPGRSHLEGYDLSTSQLTNHHYFFDAAIAVLGEQPSKVPTGVDGLKTVELIEHLYGPSLDAYYR